MGGGSTSVIGVQAIASGGHTTKGCSHTIAELEMA